jgi:hypothetical protein
VGMPMGGTGGKLTVWPHEWNGSKSGHIEEGGNIIVIEYVEGGWLLGQEIDP